MIFLIFGLIAYLLGSIPSAVWVGKKWYGVDVREAGSKNSGATNTFRLLGKKAGIIVLLLDVFKGFLAAILPVIIFNSEFEELIQTEVIHVQIICAITAVFGHVFPLFASFKGGKGVATSLGIVIGIHPPTALVCLLIFLVIFVITSYVSFGAIISALLFPVILIFVFSETDPWLITFSLVLSLAVILAHRKNIGRLLKGEENKMKLFKK